MQCPSCGFENVPGQRQCVVCSTSLTSGPVGESMLPPRAKNRTVAERIQWSVGGFPGCAAVSRGVARLRVSAISHLSLGHWPMLRMRSVRTILVSVVPGFGHLFVLRRRSTGLMMLAGSAVSLIIAAILYRTPLADVLVFGFLGLSMFSVCSVVSYIRGTPGSVEGQLRDSIGIGLVVLSIYLGTYFLLMLALSPVMGVVQVVLEVPAAGISRGDALLVWRRGAPARGETVVGTIYWQNAAVLILGPVLGVPGDRITISDRLYINGRPVTVALPPLADNEGHRRPYTQAESAEYVLRAGESWVLPNLRPAPGTDALLRVGIIRRADIQGRVVAVTSPPAHRKLLGRG